MEAEFSHPSHATSKYHVVFTPRWRKKVLFGKIKRHLSQVFHDLARRKECPEFVAEIIPHLPFDILRDPDRALPFHISDDRCRIEEGHQMPDHVHMLMISPKYSMADADILSRPWPGRGNDPSLYQKPRTGRPATRSARAEDISRPKI
jgi:putative transposase